jgi:hypothetical protein
MRNLTLLAAASRRIVDGFVVLGMLATTVFAIFVISIVFGAFSRLSQRGDEPPARAASSSTPVPVPDVSGGGNRP